MKIHFIQHISFEHPASLLKWAKQHDHSIGITHIYENISLPSVNDFDMLVMMGGPMGAYEEDKYHWLKTEKKFVKDAIDADKKVLGICLGCQIIADVLGSKVYPHTQKEIGWWPVKKIAKNKDHPLIKNLPETFTSFHWHGDTFDLPQGATHLLYSDACTQQGFVYNNNVAALQFHPEVETDLLHNLTEHDRAELITAPFIQSEETLNELLPSHIDRQYAYISSFMNEFVKL